MAEWRKMFSDPKVNGKIAVVAVDEAHCISEWLIANRALVSNNNVLLLTGVLILGRHLRM